MALHSRLARWSVLPVLTLVLSLGMVFGTETNAEALTWANPNALELAETALAPSEVESGYVLGTACVASVACAGVVGGSVLLAGAAYATRDTWMPMVSSMWDKATSILGGNSSGAISVKVTLTPDTTTAGQVIMAYSWTGGGSTNSIRVGTISYICGKVDGSDFLTQATVGTSAITISGSSGSGTKPFALCPGTY